MEYISLGSNSIISRVLKKNKNTHREMLFDQIDNLLFGELINQLENNFKEFFPRIKNIRVHNNKVNKVNNKLFLTVEDIETKIMFNDILPVGQSIKNVYNSERQRYNKIIKEFENLFRSNKPILFFRQMLDETDASTIKLVNTIRWMYPSCKFYIKHRYAGCDKKTQHNYWSKEI